MNVDIIPLFSFPVYRGTSEVSNKILDYLNFHIFGEEKYGYTLSKETTYPEIVSDLSKIIYYHIHNYLYNILSIEDNFKFKISDAWFVKVKPGGYPPHAHFHTNSLFSGVYYIKMPCRGGGIAFHKTVFNNSYGMEFNIPLKENKYNIFNSYSWEINPGVGEIILFPSSLRHNFCSNESNEDRISYAFNLVPVGNISNQVGHSLRYD